MSQQLASVMCDVTVFVSVSGEPRVPLPARLHYDRSDPYAVRLSLGAPPARPVVWVLARDLLVEGLRRPAGAGDVLVLPRHGCSPGVMRIVLRSAGGAALLEIVVSEVTRFLEGACELVPLGAEGSHVDIESALAELTGRTD
ncbi:SsgA family sporulation/cell division regulator [Streptomyces sp. AGS-58]|uniref:SsgA family sporulation/cell division regulator n=1 Tax=unclassified Streptomyces TaxID=2593676 RepID=UPI0035A2BFBC